MPLIFFKDWLFAQLPQYYKDEDTYKDLNDEGILERYLRNFGQELDEGIYPFIYNFMDLFDAVKVREDLLVHLSFILGLPPSIDNTSATYRRVLQYAVAIYKVKGTALSYKMMFNMVGLSIQIIEQDPQPPITYDLVPVIYDDNAGAYHYDDSCGPCSGYYLIAINNFDNSPVDPSLIPMLQNIICFLQPINAQAPTLIKRYAGSDTMGILITETTNLAPFVDVTGDFSDDFENDNDFS